MLVGIGLKPTKQMLPERDYTHTRGTDLLIHIDTQTLIPPAPTLILRIEIVSILTITEKLMIFFKRKES